MKNTLYYIILSLIICNGCKTGVHGGEDFDKVRKKVGLPLLKKDWYYFEHGPNIRQWARPSHGPDPAYTQSSKYLQMNKGKVVKEENYFNGKARYVSGNDTLTEELMVGAYFDDNQKDVVSWDIIYKGPISPFIRLTKPQSDSILAAWGLK